MRDAKIGLTSIAPSHGVWSVLAIVNLGREKGSTSYLCIVLGVSDCVSAVSPGPEQYRFGDARPVGRVT